ncbi:Carbohydrate esterase 4 protein [Puccinia graminis f. sp. tritici]|uniref:Carbohydrate esterase 4 protein n=1 Tax=Puccinia graminis f. sp. tritici TaxID=56615 RepID=A0A5B0QAE2_PUCGR|nr:Carbohydrate esterase 4 protein [Puccinia graminis f. sp. tritici]
MNAKIYLTFLIAFASHSSVQSAHHPKAAKHVVFSTCSKPGTLALTYDDGPYRYQNQISDYLYDRDIKGTFFVNGYNYNCIYDKDVVKHLRHISLIFVPWLNPQATSNLICLHFIFPIEFVLAWSHTNISTLSVHELHQQLDLNERALKKILGIKPKFFRAPYGEHTKENLKVLKQRGYVVVDWSSDSEDSMGASAKKSKAMYTKLAKKYPSPQIALNHETYKDTAHKVTPHAVTVLQKAGYELMHVSECLGMGSNLEDLYQWVGEPSERDVRNFPLHK